MELKKLVQNIRDIEIIGTSDLNIKKISNNSNEVKPGDLFIAIKGEKFDGHNYIKNVIKKGVQCIVCEVIPETKTKNITFHFYFRERGSIRENR